MPIDVTLIDFARTLWRNSTAVRGANLMTPDLLDLTCRIGCCAGRGNRTPTSFETRS